MKKVSNKKVRYFPTSSTTASALPRETGNPEFVPFHSCAACCFTKNTKHKLKYHLVTAEPPLTVKTIDWMHQTGPRKGA